MSSATCFRNHHGIQGYINIIIPRPPKEKDKRIETSNVSKEPEKWSFFSNPVYDFMTNYKQFQRYILPSYSPDDLNFEITSIPWTSKVFFIAHLWLVNLPPPTYRPPEIKI